MQKKISVASDHKPSTPGFLPFDSVWGNYFDEISSLYQLLYTDHKYYEQGLEKLKSVTKNAVNQRPDFLNQRDQQKANKPIKWFLDNRLVGMSLYIDRFCDTISGLHSRLDYLQDLGVNYLHLMPLFESPANESDGGYAVSDFRKIDAQYGSLEDLKNIIADLNKRDMYLMLDMVLNHTSRQHMWAQKALQGDVYYQEFYYMYDDPVIPAKYEAAMPEIFPESSPGNFTYLQEIDKWVMTVFHQYQWDLNFSNPLVLAEMIDIILFYSNLGVDVLRIDAPAFIWKKMGTNCQNLPEAHRILQLIKLLVSIASPGMAILGEAIVAPHEIMKYFGAGDARTKECDIAYNATMMALQWDALATGKTRIMKSGHSLLKSKPLGTTWINYTRCHDDIGLGYSDENIRDGGFDPMAHRAFLQSYYSGKFPGSPATGALFSVNPKTNDARISGSLASLCGLEQAILTGDKNLLANAIRKIILMQAQSFMLGGIPMIFYGDEAVYTNDYSYLNDAGKSYDNRWMHRPRIDWVKNNKTSEEGSPEYEVYQATKKLIAIRKKYNVLADKNNFEWLPDEDIHLSAFVRNDEKQKLFCLFNYSPLQVYISCYIFKSHAFEGQTIYDVWNETPIQIGKDEEMLKIPGYGILIGILI